MPAPLPTRPTTLLCLLLLGCTGRLSAQVVPVGGLSAIAYDHRVELQWEQPVNPAVQGIRIYGSIAGGAFALLASTNNIQDSYIDFRGIRDGQMREHDTDYIENSHRATLANRAYCMENPGKFMVTDRTSGDSRPATARAASIPCLMAGSSSSSATGPAALSRGTSSMTAPSPPLPPGDRCPS